MSSPIKHMLVGVFILGAISLLVSIILFLKPTIGDGKQILKVRFSDIGSLNIGTRVLFAGRAVGEVVAMHEIENARMQPTDELGRVYFYELTLNLDSSVKVYNTDEIKISTTGLLGEKSISISPKAPPVGVTPKLISDHPIYADSVDTLQSALIDFSDLATNLEETFLQLSNWMKNHGDKVASTVSATGGLMDELGQTVHTVNENGMMDDLQKSIFELYGLLYASKGAMQQLDDGKTFQSTAEMMENLSGATHAIHTTCKDVACGKGSLGKLVEQDDLYLQANAAMSKANTLMNDVNQYGILFHLNKHWQRTRVQKASLLSSLDSPQSFRTYFENEVDDINASMERLSMLISRADESAEKEQILQSASFKRDFADLLRKAHMLTENLQLYNQQLNEAIGE